jgi:hypothetical protein
MAINKINCGNGQRLTPLGINAESICYVLLKYIIFTL